jgi:RNA polymerase sigma-70 factor (ECF subfamily)
VTLATAGHPVKIVAMDAEELEASIAEARRRWPTVRLDAPAFSAHCDRVASGRPRFAAETYLAAACAAGDPGALQALDDEIVARVPAMIRTIDPSATFASEVRQRLRVRLLVGEEGAPPRIGRYTGEVPLAAWIRVIAVRLAVNAKRGPSSGDDPEAADGVASLMRDDPEVDFLRTQYREPFRRAFERALSALPRDDRTVLRLHYLDGVNIEGIGKVFGVHRATVARWIVRIRADVLRSARELLAESLGAELAEADSLIGALVEDLDVTLSRVLESARGP